MGKWAHNHEWKSTWRPWFIKATARAAVDAGVNPGGFQFFKVPEDEHADRFCAAVRDVARGVWQAGVVDNPEREGWSLPTTFNFGVGAFMQPVRTEMLALNRLRDAPVIAMPSVPSTGAPRPPAFQNNMDVGIGAYYYENVFTQAELATWVTDGNSLAWERFEGADSARWRADLGDTFAEDTVRQLVERQVLMPGYVAGKGRAAAVLKNTAQSMPEQRLHTDYDPSTEQFQKCAGAIIAIDHGVYVALGGCYGAQPEVPTVIQRRYLRPGSVLVFDADCVHAGMGGTGEVGHRRVQLHFGRDMDAKDIPPKRGARELNTSFIASPTAPRPKTEPR